MIDKSMAIGRGGWKLNVMFTFSLLCASICAAEPLMDSLLFYENCDDLKSPYPGVKISKSIKIENDGKFGKCMRIERRTVNTLDNGDFAKTSSDSMVFRGNVKWSQSGGIGDSSCLRINDGKVFIPITSLKPDYANAFSFYVKKNVKSDVSDVSDKSDLSDTSGESTLTVSWKDQGKTTVLLKNFKPTSKMTRLKLVLVSKGDSGTVAITVKGSVIIDNAQLDTGVGFFNSYVKPMKKRNVDRIQIPADGKYFRPEKGAVSCWINAEWLNGLAPSESICGVFTVRNATARVKRWGDDTLLNLSCIPANKTTTKPGTFHCYIIDAKNRNVGLGQPLNELAAVSSKKWRHVVFNWNLKDGKTNISLHIDGLKISRSKPFGPVKKQLLIYIGYSGGSYLNGLLDDFAIFNRTLTENEIKTIEDSGKSIGELTK